MREIVIAVGAIVKREIGCICTCEQSGEEAQAEKKKARRLTTVGFHCLPCNAERSL